MNPIDNRAARSPKGEQVNQKQYCIAEKDGGKVFLELTNRQMMDTFSDPIVDYCWEEDGQVFLGRTRLSSLSHLEPEVLPEEDSCHVVSVEPL